MNSIPLAERLRPKTLDDVIGQSHLVGQYGIIRKMITQGFLPSIILWGPPGVGKTTLAELLSTLTGSVFVSKSAVTTNLEEIRNIIKEAKIRLEIQNQKTILFIDEIHRFNKNQQDALLPHVEKGTIIFIGATTENPSFEVISPLLSRCRVLVLQPLTLEELKAITARGLALENQKIEEEAQTFLLEVSNGDARQLLTILDIAMQIHTGKKPLTTQEIEDASQKKMLSYDQTGDEHYNTISAFIKCMRSSDVNAALYYLARMVKAGEDPLFIARRMVIFASEDIGLAQPTALVVANAVFDGCHKVGYPEAQILLAHGVAYLSLAKKDRSSHDAFFSAMADVEQYGNLPIPKNVLNAPSRLMKDLGYGKGYEKYSTESHLPEKIKGKRYYIKKDS